MQIKQPVLNLWYNFTERFREIASLRPQTKRLPKEKFVIAGLPSRGIHYVSAFAFYFRAFVAFLRKTKSSSDITHPEAAEKARKTYRRGNHPAGHGAHAAKPASSAFPLCQTVCRRIFWEHYH